MIVQIIGLPGTGKTTLIKDYLKNTFLDIDYFDLANYTGKHKNYNCTTDIKKSSKKTIVESALGLNIPCSKVLLYKQDTRTVYHRHLLREGYLDEDYLSLLETKMIKPDFTVTTQKAMFTVLDTLFY